MGLSSESIVSVLRKKGLLDEHVRGPWGDPGDKASSFGIDWDAADSQVVAPNDGQQVIDRLDDWNAVASAIDVVGAGGDPYSGWTPSTASNVHGRSSGKTARRPLPENPDALGWYCPIHFYADGWGIYIYETSVLLLAGFILDEVKESRRKDTDVVAGALRSALEVIYLHEAFHHKTESFAIRLEIIEGDKRYLPYTQDVFTPLLEAKVDDLLEESLAVADSVRRRKEAAYQRHVPVDVQTATDTFLSAWIPELPPGYRMGLEMVRETPYRHKRGLLASQIQEGTERPDRAASDWDLVAHFFQGLLNCRAVSYVVVPAGCEPIVPWFDRPPRGSSVSARKLERFLRRYGYVRVDGGKGDHIRLKSDKDGYPPITLPGMDKDLSRTVLRSIVAALNLDSLHDLQNKMSY